MTIEIATTLGDAFKRRPANEPGTLPGKIRQRVTDAMREAVRPDIERLRTRVTDSPGQHGHHTGAYSFANIRDAWLIQNGLQLEDIQAHGPFPGGVGRWTISDEALLLSWRQFHRHHAEIVFMSEDRHNAYERTLARGEP
jgi:hypothetical protein